MNEIADCRFGVMTLLHTSSLELVYVIHAVALAAVRTRVTIETVVVMCKADVVTRRKPCSHACASV
jgi:hypothetical protein